MNYQTKQFLDLLRFFEGEIKAERAAFSSWGKLSVNEHNDYVELLHACDLLAKVAYKWDNHENFVNVTRKGEENDT